VALSLSDPVTHWEFQCLTDAAGTRPGPGGLVLQDVRHSQHNFARDLRVVGVRIKSEEVAPAGHVVSSRWQFLPLSDPPFVVTPLTVLTPAPVAHPTIPGRTFQYLREADDALQFNTYFKTFHGGGPGTSFIGYGVRADFDLPAAWIQATWPNCEVGGFTISQRFLFSRYSNHPPHEPGGVLFAARCHPFTRFRTTPNSAVDRSRNYTRFASIRIDYRLHLSLDPVVSSPIRAPGYRPPQNAGLFRDEENVASPLAPFGVVVPRAVSRVAFAAVEKPLVLEVATLGLDEGLSIPGPHISRSAPSGSGRRTWDNIHWWGARGLGSPMISAPGAFHAAHVHWRWGGAGSVLRSTIPEIDTTGVPPGAVAHPWGAAGGGRVLVDPAVWIQTIRVAVAKNDPAWDPTQRRVRLDSLSRDDWEALFASRPPDDILAGDDLVLWYSTEVHARTTFPEVWSRAIFPTLIRGALTLRTASEGTVFLHGIFFAHNPEMGGFGVGETGPSHWPEDVGTIRAGRRWRRLS
jgi:hypothetical protein